MVLRQFATNLLLWRAAILCSLCSTVLGDLRSHTYKKDESVILWTNKVGPVHNPQLTYHYHDLPFCLPKGKKEEHLSDYFGSNLLGNELTDSGLSIEFKKDTGGDVKLCSLKMTDKTLKTMVEAVNDHYFTTMYLDDLPIYGMLGDMGDSDTITADVIHEDSVQRDPKHDHSHKNEKPHLYAHKSLSISYNGNQVIEVTMTMDRAVELKAGMDIEMTYAVKWVETKKKFFNRFDRYLDHKFFEHQIHWFSIFNSFMMVLFLVGLVALILLRTLKNDCVYGLGAGGDSDVELESMVVESGWKQLYGDVFRAPPMLPLLSSMIGIGYQLYVMALTVMMFALVGTYYDTRGAFVSSAVTVYALTSLIAGYVSAAHFKRFQGAEWKLTMVVTACLLPSIGAVVISCLNCLAWSYHSSAAIPITSLMGLIMIWIFVSCPLLVIGTILGRNFTVAGDFPTRVNTVMRPIPYMHWYLSRNSLAMFGGILPFGAIFIEMYFVFSAFWNYKFYYVYGFMLLVFIILSVVSICITIVSTYFLLNSEDYRWQWTAFMSGGSTGVYVFLYGVYYFFVKTKMSGFFQMMYYFGYMSLVSTGIGFLCGTVGYLGASTFVHKLYENVKSD